MIHQDCEDGSPDCRLIECKLKRLGKSQSAVVKIVSTLVEATFDVSQIIVLGQYSESRLLNKIVAEIG